MGQAAFGVWLHRARPILLLAAALSCDPKETDYFLTAENTKPIGDLTGLVSVGTNPLNGVTITLTGPESRSTTTGTTGTYAFADLTPGDYTVTAAATNFNCPPVTATIVAFATTTRNIVCTPQPGTVNGTVRLDLAPVAGVAVTARQGTNTVGTATTGSDGTYTIPNLLPGAYTIAMTPPSNTICPTTERDVTVQSNLTTTADFDCTTAPGSVTGTVRVDGAGQSGVTVTLAQGATTIGTATTAAGGTYTIANVLPGAYTASITPPAGTVCVANSQSVTVQANGAATADFDCTTLRGALTGVVRLNSVGQSGVTVTLTQGATTIGSTTTAAGGTYTFSNLQPATLHSDDHPPGRDVMHHEFPASHRSGESGGCSELRLHQLHCHSDQPVTQLSAHKWDFVRDVHGNYNHACAAGWDMDRDVDRNGYRRRNNADRDAQRERHGCRSSADHFLGNGDDLHGRRDRDLARCITVSNRQRNRADNSGDLPSVTGD